MSAHDAESDVESHLPSTNGPNYGHHSVGHVTLKTDVPQSQLTTLHRETGGEMR